MKACIATILGVDHKRVPDPSRDFNTGWFDRYNKRVETATGYRLDKISRNICPPGNPTQLWIATIREDGPSDHCVVARGYHVVHDPAGTYTGPLPMGRLIDGIVVVPNKRVVPVLSPLGNGYTVVAA